MINFSESGHPVFRGSSASERGALRSKEKGKLSIHVCGVDATADLVLRTVISFNQLSVSTELWRTCATNWPGESLVVQKVQGNPLLRTIRRPW